MIYLKYSCVTSPLNSLEDLSYNQAVEKYSNYKDAKTTDKKTKTSDYFLYKRVRKLYKTKLCFNENLSLFRAENIADSTLFLSGIWNKWLLDSMYSNKPFIFQEDFILYENIDQQDQHMQFKIDLFLLRFLLPNDRSKIPSSFYAKANGMTTNLYPDF